MITKPTVFITGAGASKEFNFPLGSELILLLIQQINQLNPAISQIQFRENNFSWPRGIAEELSTQLRYASPRSIDTFIQVQSNEKYSEMAKFYIAMSLLRKEHEDAIIDSTSSYLLKIWHEMLNGSPSLEDFRKNKVSFVTFNYDRTIEYFFITRIAAHYGITVEDAIEFIKAFPIIHVYGDMNALETLFNQSHESYFKYGTRPELDERDTVKVH